MEVVVNTVMGSEGSMIYCMRGDRIGVLGDCSIQRGRCVCGCLAVSSRRVSFSTPPVLITCHKILRDFE